MTAKAWTVLFILLLSLNTRWQAGIQVLKQVIQRNLVVCKKKKKSLHEMINSPSHSMIVDDTC